jgi:hypothetical protein
VHRLVNKKQTLITSVCINGVTAPGKQLSQFYAVLVLPVRTDCFVFVRYWVHSLACKSTNRIDIFVDFLQSYQEHSWIVSQIILRPCHSHVLSN